MELPTDKEQTAIEAYTVADRRLKRLIHQRMVTALNAVAQLNPSTI